MIKSLSNFVLISFLTCISFFIHTQLRIEVTQGIKDPIRIAVTPIIWNLESPASHYIHQIISSDFKSPINLVTVSLEIPAKEPIAV